MRQTLVECQPWSMNHSAQNWEAPWEFRPERFIDKSGRDVMESLQPFSVGKSSLTRSFPIDDLPLPKPLLS